MKNLILALSLSAALLWGTLQTQAQVPAPERVQSPTGTWKGFTWATTPQSEMVFMQSAPVHNLAVMDKNGTTVLTCDTSAEWGSIDFKVTNCTMPSGATLDEVMTLTVRSFASGQKQQQERYNDLEKRLQAYFDCIQKLFPAPRRVRAVHHNPKPRRHQ